MLTLNDPHNFEPCVMGRHEHINVVLRANNMHITTRKSNRADDAAAIAHNDAVYHAAARTH
jgi:hypothetical protein